jgi:hypothetical protein
MFAVMPLEGFVKGLSEMNVQVGALSNGRAQPSLCSFETGAVLVVRLRAKQPEPQVKPSGGGRESNPPRGVNRVTGFEVRGRSCCRVLPSTIWCCPVHFGDRLHAILCHPVASDDVLDVCNLFASETSMA